jgi:copper oxidase (laccase) domain-containing protein
VQHISGGTWCTFEDASRFFSFRRDRVTGRMVAAAWLLPRS